jgi:hypothetical protein
LLCLLLQHLPYISLRLSSLCLSGTACFCLTCICLSSCMSFLLYNVHALYVYTS